MTLAGPADLDDLFRGLVLYGTGGGGRAAAGLAILRGHFGSTWRPIFVDPDTLPQDAFACATIVVGGRDPDEDVTPNERHALGLPPQDLSLGTRFARSVQALERATGRTIAALAVVELGSLAMAATLVAADMLGKAVLDCDGTGRSIPELGLSKLDLTGILPAPAALVDRFGGETIILGTASAAMADRVARQISRAVWGRGLACAGYLQPLARFRQGLVPDSVARAKRIGALLGGSAPIEERLRALLSATEGRLLCRGIAQATHWRSAEPYMFRELDYVIAGSGDDAEHEIRVWVKNEHHMVWYDDTLVASSPDPIAVLDARSLEPLTTLGDVEDGKPVLVVSLPALDPIWNTDLGLAVLGPRRFGFEPNRVEPSQ